MFAVWKASILRWYAKLGEWWAWVILCVRQAPCDPQVLWSRILLVWLLWATMSRLTYAQLGQSLWWAVVLLAFITPLCFLFIWVVKRYGR